MRSVRDRIRHSLLFELIAVLTIAPLGALIFGLEMWAFGILAVLSTTIAIFWTYAFNLAFDHVIRWQFGHVTKTLPIRVIHALLFEIGLLCLFVPFIAWYLDVSWWHAFVIDVSMAGFYVVYAFAFNWIYDVVFPVETHRRPS